MMADLFKRMYGMRTHVSNESALRLPADVDACVCVKCSIDARVMAACKRALIVDLVDHSIQRDQLRRWSNQSRVAWVVQTDDNRDDIRRDFGVDAFISPHGHSNFWSSLPKKKSAMLTVGFVGYRKSFLNDTQNAAMQALVRSKGAKFELIDYTTIASTSPSLANYWQQRRYHAQLAHVDVAVIWLSRDWSRFAMRYRPPTRLLTFWASAIPTVFPRDSAAYMAALARVRQHAPHVADVLSYGAAPSFAHAQARVGELLRNASRRDAMADAARCAQRLFSPIRSAHEHARVLCDAAA